MSIKKEAYGVGAILTKGLGSAAKYLGEKSEQAAGRLREMESRATTEAVTEREDAQRLASEDFGDLIRGFAQKARAEGAEISNDLQAEIKNVLTRLDAVLTEQRKGKASETPDTEAEDTKQTHF